MSDRIIRLSGVDYTEEELLTWVLDENGHYLQDVPAALSPAIRKRRIRNPHARVKYESFKRLEAVYLFTTAALRVIRSHGHAVPMVTLTMPMITDPEDQREIWRRAMRPWRRALNNVMDEWGGGEEIRSTEATVHAQPLHVHRHWHSLLLMAEGVQDTDSHPEEMYSIELDLRAKWREILERVIPRVTGTHMDVSDSCLRITEYRCDTAHYLVKDKGLASRGESGLAFADRVVAKGLDPSAGYMIQELEEGAALGSADFIEMLDLYHRSMRRVEKITVSKTVESMLVQIQDANCRYVADRREHMAELYRCLGLTRTPWRGRRACHSTRVPRRNRLRHDDRHTSWARRRSPWDRPDGHDGTRHVCAEDTARSGGIDRGGVEAVDAVEVIDKGDRVTEGNKTRSENRMSLGESGIDDFWAGRMSQFHQFMRNKRNRATQDYQGDHLRVSRGATERP